MGSEQSNHQEDAVRIGLRRGKSVPDYRVEENPENDESENSRAISPEPSVCSDSDLPYISYTVNSPIGGDSPKKKPTRRFSRGKSNVSCSNKIFGKVVQIPQSRTGHDIVVVNTASLQPSKQNDPDLVKLKNIPMFLPIMRATLHTPAARDPEVLERLDSAPLFNFCHLYQQHLNECAMAVSRSQENLAKQIVAVDKKSAQILSKFNENQKVYAKHVINFEKIEGLVLQVNKISQMLDETLNMVNDANNSLPNDLKLKPFIWI